MAPEHPDPAVRKWSPGDAPAVRLADLPKPAAREVGGRKDGPEPTRYGDWEKQGRCIDF